MNGWSVAGLRIQLPLCRCGVFTQLPYRVMISTVVIHASLLLLISTQYYAICLVQTSLHLSVCQLTHVNLNYLLCPALMDPFAGPYYRLWAVFHQTACLLLLGKIYTLFLRLIIAVVSLILPARQLQLEPPSSNNNKHDWILHTYIDCLENYHPLLYHHYYNTTFSLPSFNSIYNMPLTRICTILQL